MGLASLAAPIARVRRLGVPRDKATKVSPKVEVCRSGGRRTLRYTMGAVLAVAEGRGLDLAPERGKGNRGRL